MGIHFNAATTQIVPFLTLGLGIDDMFLILHNYNGVLESVRRKEVAVLLKETGMSILITSINNILAFLTGTILPIPALRSFCSQTAILLFFNVMCIIAIYPAFIALDIQRRKDGVRDLTLGCCCCSVPYEVSGASSKEKVITLNYLVAFGFMLFYLNLKLQESSSRNQLVKNSSINSAATTFQEVAALAVATNKDDKSGVVDVSLKWYTLDGFCHLYYIPLLMRTSTKLVILLICLFLFAFGCVGHYRSKLGLELSDVLPVYLFYFSM